MKFAKIISGLVIGFLIINACSNHKNSSGESKPVEKKQSVVIKNNDSVQKLNDVADFISGKEVRKESEFYELSKTEVWQRYHQESEKAWENFKLTAEKYKSFAQQQLVAPYDTLTTLFYPFSGPDFLFANILFPQIDNMILIGLESPGSIPAIKDNNPDSLSGILNLYRLAIEDVVQLSFFRTVDMKNELANQSIDGTTPIIMLFLARSGKEIVNVQKSYFNDNGIAEKTEDNKLANGVVIKYREPGNSKLKTITYISTNLADPSLKKNKPVLTFLKNIQYPTLTFVKSATYLMHKPYFSIIRNTCLEKSALILQDDSGISFRYFKKDRWNFHFFGTYSKPIDMFSMYFQEDYLNAFKNTKPAPLNFRVGYNRNSNLLLALRNKK